MSDWDWLLSADPTLREIDRAAQPPPCTSTDHDHDELRTFGGHLVRRICREVDR